MIKSFVSFAFLALLAAGAAQPAAASSLGQVASINGSALVMRGNKVERLDVGSKIEKGDRIIVPAGGRVTLSNGASLGPGTSSISKGTSGKLEIATTTSTKSSSYDPKPNSSRLFSDKSGKGKDYDDDRDDRRGDRDDDDRDDDRKDDDRDGKGKDKGRGHNGGGGYGGGGGHGDDDDDDNDEEDDDDDDGYPHEYPDDHHPVSRKAW